nr:hypothetical protein [Tanacetum cinerariifolium]
MVAYLTKSDASEGFNQVIDFLNGSYIKYALTVNLNIYVSCIKQFWNTVAIKQVNDVTRLQALVDKKKVMVIEAVIREKVFANMRRVRKGFSRVETPLFKGMLVGQEIEEGGDEEEHVDDVTAGDAAQGDDTATHREVPTARVEHLEYDKVAQALEITKLKRRVKKLEKGNRGRIINEIDKDDAVALMDDKEDDKKDKEVKVVENDQVQGRQAKSQAEIYRINIDHASKVLSMQEDEPAEVQEVVGVVTTAKLITEVVTASSAIISAAEP